MVPLLPSPESKSRNQEVEMEGAPLPIIPCDPVAKSLLSVPITICPAALEVLTPEGEMLPPGDTAMIPLYRKLRLPPAHFGLCMLLNQQAKKDITVLTG